MTTDPLVADLLASLGIRLDPDPKGWSTQVAANLSSVLAAARAVVDASDGAAMVGDPNPVGHEVASLRDALAAADGAR